MQNKKLTALLSATAIAAALASTGAFAQTDGKVFVRGEVGRTHLDNRDDSGRLKDNSFVVRGGYMFTPNVGVEGFVGRYYGKSHEVGSFDHDNSVDGFGVGAVGKVRFGDQAADTGFFGMGRAGYMRSSYDATTHGTVDGVDIRASRSTHSHQPYVGIGVGYDFAPNMGVSLNYDHFRGKAKLPTTGERLRYNNNTLSAGFEYRF